MRVFTQVQVFVDRLNLFNEVKMERGQAEKTKKKGTEELEPLGATGIYDKDAWIVFDG